MPVNPKLLEILVCPITKQSVRILNEADLAKLNRLIDDGAVVSVGGEAVSETLSEALVTANGNTIYPIEDSIPIMLEDRSIACEQLAGW